jgi:hypothetical protein
MMVAVQYLRMREFDLRRGSQVLKYRRSEVQFTDMQKVFNNTGEGTPDRGKDRIVAARRQGIC